MEESDDILAARRDVTALYGRYARRLLAFLAGRGLPTAELEDVHHEVWVRVWTQLNARPFEGHFRGWLFQVARNLATDLLRKRRPEALGETDPEAGRATPLDAMMDAERRERLAHCLQGLNAEQSAIVRGKLSGENYDELCNRLGLEPAQAHKLFFNAKQKLEACMGRADA
jgi:RNA polymerase sigma factor (sigma-70 family)